MIVQIARNFDRPKIDISKSLQILLLKVKSASNLDFQGLGIENIIVLVDKNLAFFSILSTYLIIFVVEKV